MNEDVPARQAMALYFEGKDLKGRQGNFCSIASVLSDDYKKAFSKLDLNMKQLPRWRKIG